MTELELGATPCCVRRQAANHGHGSLTSLPHPLAQHLPESHPPLPTMASPPPVEDQARLLEDALAVVRQQTMLMRRCLETPGKLMDALKCRYAARQIQSQRHTEEALTE